MVAPSEKTEHTPLMSTIQEFKNYFLDLPPLEQAGFFLWPSLASDKLTEKEIELLKVIRPSGIIFFKRNLSSMEQASKLIAQIRSIVEDQNSPFFKPLITAIDEEGGRVSRLPVENIRGKSALEYATTNDIEGLKKQISLQCHYAKQIGINCLLAPVADILTEPNNPVMGDRCFGYDAQIVSKFSSIVHKVMQDNRLWSCAKHFPGHGNTLTDSHKEFSSSNVTLEKLKSREWLPFQKLISENVPFIMAAHVLLPYVDDKNPATLSYKILTEHLRQELGFQGLILSDDLRMNAIALHYSSIKTQDSSITEEIPVAAGIQDDSYLEKASIDALNAGCDILLSCQSIEREIIIANAIAKKIQSEDNFKEKMLEKAWKIYSELLAHDQASVQKTDCN